MDSALARIGTRPVAICQAALEPAPLALQPLAQQPHVAPVRAPQNVKGIADQRHRTEHAYEEQHKGGGQRHKPDQQVLGHGALNVLLKEPGEGGNPLWIPGTPAVIDLQVPAVHPA